MPERQSNEAKRLLMAAVEHLESALNKATTNLRIMRLLANCLWRIAVILHTEALQESVAAAEQSLTEDESESGTEEVEIEASSSAAISATYKTRSTTPVNNVATRLHYNTSTPTTNFVTAAGNRNGSLRKEEVMSRIESIRYLVRANQTLDRLMQLCVQDATTKEFVSDVHELWGDIRSELGRQFYHYIPQKKRHGKMRSSALSEYKLAFAGPCFAEMRERLANDVLSELSASSRIRSALSEHTLQKLHPKLEAALAVQPAPDQELLLIIGELEVSLSKLVVKPAKAQRFLELALMRFQTVHRSDPLVLEEYYLRKRNVLFSVAQHHQDLEHCKGDEVLEYIIRRLNRDGIFVDIEPERRDSEAENGLVLNSSSSIDSAIYPKTSTEYDLLKPMIQNKEGGKASSSGTLWKAQCLNNNKEVVVNKTFKCLTLPSFLCSHLVLI